MYEWILKWNTYILVSLKLTQTIKKVAYGIHKNIYFTFNAWGRFPILEHSLLQYKLIIFINLFCLNILFRNTLIIKIYLFYSYFRMMSTPELNNLPGVSTGGIGRPLSIYMNMCFILCKYVFLFVYEYVHVCIYACVCVFMC